MKIIDTHFHLWDASVLTLPTLQLFKGQLKEKYTLEDYSRAIKGFPILESVYMEVDAIKEEHQKEAEMAIDLCKDPSNIVVGATIAGDLATETFKEYIALFAKESAVKSVRHNMFAADPAVTKSQIFIENVNLLAELGLMCDLVMPVEKILSGVHLVKACPKTTFVVDHCGLCPVGASKTVQEPWKKAISAYAKNPNVICKVSECGFTNPHHQWSCREVEGIIFHCIESFGPERIVYGTNWPICTITGTVGGWIEALESVLRRFPVEYSENLFFQNAKRLYFL